jgi:hypothetical protein
MSEQSEFPLVDVAVSLVTSGPRVLVAWNPKWGEFSLPMTKRRVWRDPRVAASHHAEDWNDAAARAAAECLGRTCEPEFLLDVPGEYQQSDRDGAWKRYNFQVFQLTLADQPDLVPGVVAEWLSPKEVLNCRPISPTARFVIGKLQEAGRI